MNLTNLDRRAPSGVSGAASSVYFQSFVVRIGFGSVPGIAIILLHVWVNFPGQHIMPAAQSGPIWRGEYRRNSNERKKDGARARTRLLTSG